VVGEILRKRREELGLDLRTIADTLKIRYDYLKAIEDETLEMIPAEIYLKGYILEYSKILNIDQKTIMDAYAAQTSHFRSEKEKNKGQEMLKKRRFKLAYLLFPVVLGLLIIIVSSIQFSSSPEKTGSKNVVLPEGTNILTDTQKESRDNSSLPLNQTAVTDSQAEATLKEENHVLEVHASETTWLFVTIDDGDSQEILMQPGESVRWSAKNCFTLKIGNAGGVRLVFDGKEFDTLGEKGQVVKIEFPEKKT